MGKLLFFNDITSAGDNEIWNPKEEYKNLKVYNNWIKPPLFVNLIPRKM